MLTITPPTQLTPTGRAVILVIMYFYPYVIVFISVALVTHYFQYQSQFLYTDNITRRDQRKIFKITDNLP